ncbi:MAG TPA: ubiquitin-like small modifier protein 1 [Dehalococcoidia bacterium]|nr:ubiquitin-like small modifier protein 1 [Dehalococcoidia bacterium]
MVQVRIPTPLRKLTNDIDIVNTDAATLAEAVDRLDADYPGLKERIVDEQGQIRRFVNVYINGEDVRFLDGMSSALKPNDEISIVPAVAGG